jgi:hypothetical protein
MNYLNKLRLNGQKSSCRFGVSSDTQQSGGENKKIVLNIKTAKRSFPSVCRLSALRKVKEKGA